MLGRELMQFILDNSLEDEEVTAICLNNDSTDAFTVESISANTNETGDTICELVIEDV